LPINKRKKKARKKKKMSILYRYKCQTENELVWEYRTLAQGPPTVCVNDGANFYAATLTILEEPNEVQDLVINSTVDFDGATIMNLSHTTLEDIGSHSHSQIDSHIEDATIHRTINDASSSATALWSASKITSELAGKAPTAHSHSASDITDFNLEVDSRADDRIDTQKGVANGLATLDGSGKIPSSQLTLNTVTYQGTWNATTNSPALVSSVGTSGQYYVVSTAGSTELDGVSDWQSGDWVIFNGSAWEKSDNTDKVTSVAGRSGVVVLDSTDITDFESAVSAVEAVSAATSHIANTSNPHNVTLDQITLASAKGDLLSHSGSATVVRSLGSAGQVLQVNSGETSGLSWVNNKKFIVSSRAPYKSTSELWNRVDHFIYPGSSISAANVSRVLINAQAESGVTYSVRLYDATQAVDIAKVTGQTNSLPAIINLGTVANVPSTDNLFEVHVMRTAGTDPNGVVYFSTMLEY
jgi:hypothetical protein